MCVFHLGIKGTRQKLLTSEAKKNLPVEMTGPSPQDLKLKETNQAQKDTFPTGCIQNVISQRYKEQWEVDPRLWQGKWGLGIQAYQIPITRDGEVPESVAHRANIGSLSTMSVRGMECVKCVYYKKKPRK